MSIRAFEQHNISPLFEQYHHLVRQQLFEAAGAKCMEIADLIKDAATAFPNEKKYIEGLQILQSKCWSDLQARIAQPKVLSAADIHPNVMREFAPVGIFNRGGNDCWANATLQFLANTIPSKVFAHRGGKCRVIVAELQKLFDAQITGKSVSAVDSQVIRKDLKPRSGHRQEEAFEALQGLLDRIGFGFHIDTKIVAAGAAIKAREHSIIEPMLRFDIDSAKPQFNDLLAKFFNHPVEYDGQPMMKKTQFRHAPDDLIIHAKRYQHKDAKIQGIPENFELGAEHTAYDEQGVHYELTSCIIHSGKDNSGHYICLVKKPDGWYRANDSLATKLTNKDAHELLKDGYIFHYRKHIVEKPAVLEPLPEIRSAVEPLPAKPSRSCSTWVAQGVQTMTASFFKLVSYPINWYYSSAKEPKDIVKGKKDN